MTRVAVLMIATFVFATGCDVEDEEWFVSDGNRAAATVTLTCTPGDFSTCPSRPDNMAKWDAHIVCTDWGYKTAVPFGGITTIRRGYEIVGIEIKYRCTDRERLS